MLLKDIERGNFDGIGKPEPLKGDMSGYWSRRIDDVNRLVYRINGDVMEIVSCKGHYEDDKKNLMTSRLGIHFSFWLLFGIAGLMPQLYLWYT